MNEAFNIAFAKIDTMNAELTKTQVAMAKYNGLQEKATAALEAAVKATEYSAEVRELVIRCQAEHRAQEVVHDKVEEVKEKDECKKEIAVKEVKTEHKKDKFFWIMAFIAIGSLIVSIITAVNAAMK